MIFRVSLYFPGLLLAINTCVAADFGITAFQRSGMLFWANGFPNGVCAIDTALSAAGPWQPGNGFYTSNSVGQTQVPLTSGGGYFRLWAADVSGTPGGFTNLVNAYGVIRTIAGLGEFGTDLVNYWDPSYEGGPATNANLSRPHMAMADPAGNVYIADKNSHSILKVTTDGTIHTVAGNHTGGYNGDGPDLGTNLRLNFPNGLWVRNDGTVYILDTDNGRVRRLATNGVMTTLFTVGGTNGISVGRGLWVKDDESLVYFCAGTKLKKWTPGSGVKNINTSFVDLGNLIVDPQGQLVVTDRGANFVYRVNATTGALTVIAGDGSTSNGGDGFPALNTGLYGVRGVWFLPNGGYLLATHEGSRIWYVDTAGIIHLFVDGAPYWHTGDGDWFHSPGYKVSEPRSVTLDPQGNILIVENDTGYVRMISFTRMPPSQ